MSSFKNFAQGLLNDALFNKLTTTLPFLRKDTFDKGAIEETLHDFKRKGYLKALQDSGQDPEEIIEMALEGFDHAVAEMRKRLEARLKMAAQAYKASQPNM